ncbi:PadR family transcriptional regulator [uncultured Arthrobacter sp.]|uniref:PadR family transcriptional regulator n=1 Tax=uncultured Arthrobacter sp. TaxID=114050 RepID=UPI002623FDFF|nr:PadR family transcriptional regulator [uncultured Arthrobacter sp.]
MERRQWRNELARGTLSFAALSVLSHEEVHGYELLIRLRECGFGHIKGGVMYPILARLESEGLVSHAWDTTNPGPARKILRLTPEGQAELAEARRAWQEIITNMDRLSEGRGDEV